MAYDLRAFPQRYPLSLVVDFARGLLPAVVQMDRVGGDLVSSASRVPALPGVHLVRHPDLVREVLVDRNADLHKARGLRLARTVLGSGLLTAETPQHTRQRRLVLPAFHHRRLSGYGRTMVRLTLAEADTWADGGVLDATAATHRLTLGIAGETLFGADVGAQTREISAALDAAFAGFDASQFPGAEKLTWLPTTARRRTRRAVAVLDRIVYGLLNARRGAAPGDDLLQMLLDAEDADTGERMSDREVRDEALTLLLAGHETTAVALAWTLGLLAEHPDAQAAVYTEVASLGRAPAFGDLRGGLPLTRAAVSESMRLRPPAWAFAREAWRDTAIGGRPVERGDTLLVAPYCLHRDARYWPDAARFDLGRWTAPASRPKFAYLPFSAGQRGCIGEPFAWAELVLSLATLLRRWRIERVGPLPGLDGTVTLRPSRPVRIRTVRRDAAAASKV